MMFYENIVMGLIATVCGTVLGSVFSRFFRALLDIAPRDPSEVLWHEADRARLAAVRAERARAAETRC